ncbi:putative non-specific serine/threonine protein kinase [Helianthus annuus]|nr:putative non-specific serine/threonine protein kinase [Helianthus annuus]
MVQKHRCKEIYMVANRENPLSVSDNRTSLIIADDGNLRIQDGDQNTIWLTKVRSEFNGTIAQLIDVGDFCTNDTITGSILWESFDYPGNSLLPGMKLETKGNPQGKHLLSSWKSDDDPTPGNFVVGLSAEQPPQYSHGVILSQTGEVGPGMDGSSQVYRSRMLGTHLSCQGSYKKERISVLTF